MRAISAKPDPKKRTIIRYLGNEDPIPEGEPRRYKDARGYVRLRWHVGPNEYVEAWEHRIVAGRPRSDVHHRDDDKANNDAENLDPMRKGDHTAYHNRSRPRRGSQRDRDRATRRQRRAEKLAAMRAGYESGLSTIQLASLYGLTPGQVSRVLRSAGTQMRPRNGYSTVHQAIDARASLRCERCGLDLTYRRRHHHHLRVKGMGGSIGADDPAEMALLCDDCHQWAHDHPAEAKRTGWMIRRGDTCL